jgi:hypothetical protein
VCMMRPMCWSPSNTSLSSDPLTPASSLRHFSSSAAFVFACVFDGEDAPLAVSAGGLDGHGGVPFLPSWFATFALMQALIISLLVWRSLVAVELTRRRTVT